MKYSLILIAFLGLSAARAAVAPKPKYGPEISLLRESHEFIRENTASDYWAISPHYASQMNDGACSLASVTMVMNALRSRQELTADDELVTQEGLLKKVNDSFWKQAVGPLGRGVTLEQLKGLVEKSLKAYGFDGYKVEIHYASDTLPTVQADLHKTLVENEKSAKDFVILNFLQSVYTGDAEVGHISPLGAYDSKLKRALIFDSDRKWYEPYWVSEETLLKGLATQDSVSKKNRGWLWIKPAQ